MPDQIKNKLDAYLDGQLDRRGQIEVEAHLETCPACQAELEELRRLSHLLRAAPLPDFTSTLDFKAQFMLQLPRRAPLEAEHAQGDPAGRGREAQHTLPNDRLLPWLAPALVLAGWVFIQGALSLSSLISVAGQAGFLNGAAAWTTSDPQQMLWFAAVQATLGGVLGPQGQAGLLALNDAGLFTQNLVIALLLQVGVAVLYWGIMALVWHHKVKALWSSPMVG